MNTRIIKLFISFVFLGTGALFIMSLSSFNDGNHAYHESVKMLKADLEGYEKAVRAFEKRCQQGDETSIRRFYFNDLRPALKRNEWVLAYFDAEAYTKWINGAPLPKLEKNVPNPAVIQPNGFQTIDEWMGEEEGDLQELMRLSEMLTEKSQAILKIIRKMPYHERHFFEAARTQILRIYTLGITGFDAPGSLNSLPDAQVSLHGLQQWLGLYQSEGEKKWSQGYSTLMYAFENGLKSLGESDFETFDRARFYKECIQPIYTGIYQFQKALGVETSSEVDNSTPSINPFAEHLFSSDFLNLDYYMEMPPSAQFSQRKALGQLLFFDPVLSFNAQRSCASCHQPEYAFTEPRAKSLANEEGKTIARNAPGLINAVYAQDFFYDLRTGRLQDQIEHVVFSHDEFNMHYDSIVKRLKISSEYQELFKEAFPELKNESTSQYSINVAIASYLSTLTDWNTPFDRYMRSEQTLDQDAIAGFNLFMGKAACATCHFPPTFAGLVPPAYEENESEVLGITVNADFNHPQADEDPGRYASGKPIDRYDFYKNSMKTTTVRNAAFTAPYMHNGSLSTLEELIEFYNKGGGAGMGLDIPHQTLSSDPLDLSDLEKKQLIAFIHSLGNNPFKKDAPPKLPQMDDARFANRISGGSY